MRGIVASLFTLTLILFSCSRREGEQNQQRMASFEIEGMVCEMGCGASLRKGLYTTDAVDEVKVEYEEQRKKNLIHVYYQEGKTDPESMKSIIEKLNEGQFSAELVEDKVVASSPSESVENSDSRSGGNVDGLEASTESFALPNLTELLNSLIY